ncbi:hypothetical protein J8J40_27510, partial [Mycobacterium tuberculosis]|nr:hypothetical protein [Mycobacterium tuberculosis]
MRLFSLCRSLIAGTIFPLVLAGCETVSGPAGSGVLVTPAAPAAATGASGGAPGKFVGELALGPEGCETTGKCQL